MTNQFYSNNQKYTEIEQTVLDYIAEHQENLKQITIQKLADETFTSKSTIFRLAKKLGFDGFTDMIYHLSKNQSIDDDGMLETYTQGLSSNVQKIFKQNEANLQQFIRQIDKEECFIYVIGTGYSGIIGEYLYKKVLGKGELVYYSNGADSNALFLSNIQRITDIICISKSGETDLVNSKAKLAKENKIGVISFTHSLDNSLAKLSDIPFIIDDNQILDRNNINPTQFYSMLLLYLEYLIEKSF